MENKLVRLALEVGQEYWKAKDMRRLVSPVLATEHALPSRLAFSKWRDGVGGRLRFFDNPP